MGPGQLPLLPLKTALLVKLLIPIIATSKTLSNVSTSMFLQERYGSVDVPVFYAFCCLSGVKYVEIAEAEKEENHQYCLRCQGFS